MADVTWTGLNDIERNMKAHGKNIGAACFEIAQYFAPQMESYAKQNGAWQDRTGNLRQSLWGKPEREGDAAVIILSHGQTYGKWLEIANAGRYAIIWPTVEHYLPEIRSRVRDTFR